MGNSILFRNEKSNFVEQIKADKKGQLEILGIYINPNEFPTGGLIVITQKSILSYNPIYGNLNISYYFSKKVLFCDYNRKSKEGALLSIVTEDNKLFFIFTENLTINRTINIMKKNNLQIRDNSKISCINFHLNDSLLIACSDGSVIKCKLNDEPVNLLYEIKGNNFKSPEDEFASIKNVFSTDSTINNNKQSFVITNKKEKKIFEEENEKNIEITNMKISDKFRILFCFHKISNGKSNISLFNLRTNTFMYIFTKIKGIILCGEINDKKDLLIIISFNISTRKSTIEIWMFNDNSCPISTFELNDIIDYNFSVSSICLVKIPNFFFGKNSANGIIKGDILILGTSKGDVIIGSIKKLEVNNKMGFDYIMTYKLHKNKENKIDDFSNKFKINFINYDLNFDTMFFGDVSSNVRFIEKVLQMDDKKNFYNNFQDNLPFFSFDDNYLQNNQLYQKYEEEKKKNINYNLPLFSINHDVIKDRSIILYDKGKDIIIKKNTKNEDNNLNLVNSNDLLENNNNNNIINEEDEEKIDSDFDNMESD